MQKNPGFFRLTASVALTALLWNTLLPIIVLAQPAPPPLPVAGEGRPELSKGDPPARVGRIASIKGIVSFHDLGDTQWTAASPNYPVSSGNAFWTEPSSSARLEVSDSRVVMAGATEFDVATLDASGLQGVAAQGGIYLHLRDLTPKEVWSIQTPRGLVRLSGEGRYQIMVGTTDQPTLVTVVDGSAQIDGPGVSLQVSGSQTATITGVDSFHGSIGPAIRDAFLTATLEAERPRPAAAVPVPTQVYAMAGGSDLDGSGRWSQAPSYGQVWYPPVPANWVPYREGHWAYVAPWGWTWIDDASWGFAPFHYGRWVQIEGRWAWTPGEITEHERPVYAPALVTFIGVGAGVALGAALASGTIGWVPLGPREQFHPWYHASNNYVRQVNVSNVTNITNNVTTVNYVNRGAATSIPAAAMAASRPVQAVARPVTAQQFAAARPIAGQQPIRPTAATAGVTPVVARQLNLAPAARVAHPAPGPALHAAPAGTNGFARPTFAPAGRTPAPAADEQTRPAQTAPGARPGVAATPERAHPATVSQTTPHQQQPDTVRPQGVRPPTPEPARPATVPHSIPHQQPGAGRPEAVPVTPHVVPQSPPHQEYRAAPATQPAVVRPTPSLVRPAPETAPASSRPPAVAIPPERSPAAVTATPRPEPQHAAPPSPHPEARPATPVHPEPQEHRKQPNER